MKKSSVPVLTASTKRNLLDILKPQQARLLIIALAILAGASLELVPSLIMKQVVDVNLVQRQASGLWTLALFYLGSIAGVQGLSFLTNYLTGQSAQSALHALRVRLYAHLQRLPIRYFDQNASGDIISRCTVDVDALDQLFSSGVAVLLTDLVRLVTVSIAMVALSPALSLALLLVVPLLVGVTNAFRSRIRDAERRSRKAVGALNAQLQETLGGVEIIRAYGREPAFVARFRRVLKQVLTSYNQSAHYSAVYSPLMQILMAAVIALLLWTGAQPVFSAFHISLGTLTAFVLLFKRFFDPITAIGEEWQTVQSALAGAERIFQVLDQSVEDAVPARAAPPVDRASGIEVQGVSFGYVPDQPILRQVSFSVAPGEHVVLVGRTGTGKSSILNLVSGLYEPWEGRVRVAGLTPQRLPEAERRKVIGVVPQKVQLFSGTVTENLTLGDDSVPLEAVRGAARLTGANGFIESLPMGYETPVSSGSGCGVQLSAGQRQLLSLTRALVWNPGVLLFDEATSAIDSASEAAFRQALQGEAVRRQRAILTVAHRLSTAREADRVIVLERGRIIEMGTPAELVRKRGRFAALLDLEAAGWDWQTGPLKRAFHSNAN